MWPVLLLLLMWGGVSLAGSQCERSSAVRFSVSSWRNQTGHRLVTAGMRSDDSLKDAVSLSVDQWTEQCGAAGAVALSVTASSAGPSSIATTPAPIVTTRPTPLPDYRHFPGLGYYKIHGYQVTWEEGRHICEGEGAHLAVPDSQEELEALTNNFGCCPSIGVHRQDPSSPWMTVLGQPLNSSFKIWAAGQPHGKANCAYLSDSGRGINNVDICSSVSRFVCEFEQ